MSVSTGIDPIVVEQVECIVRRRRLFNGIALVFQDGSGKDAK